MPIQQGRNYREQIWQLVNKAITAQPLNVLATACKNRLEPQTFFKIKVLTALLIPGDRQRGNAAMEHITVPKKTNTPLYINVVILCMWSNGILDRHTKANLWHQLLHRDKAFQSKFPINKPHPMSEYLWPLIANRVNVCARVPTQA